MVEPLAKIIKREEVKTKLIEGEVCLSLLVAAKFMGISRMTAYRWYKKGIYERYYIDKINGYAYIPIKVVENLRPENRMIEI